MLEDLSKPGVRDPIEDLRGIARTDLTHLIFTLQTSREPEFGQVQDQVNLLLSGYSDGSFVFNETDSFNRYTALILQQEFMALIIPGVSAQELITYRDKVQVMTNDYARETGQLHRIDELFEMRRKTDS